MRTFGYGIVALLAFVVPGATQEGGFQVPEGGSRVPVTLGPPAGCVIFDLNAAFAPAFVPPLGPNTTDVVLTDADGRVLECWRGDFKPGEVVRLGIDRLSPGDALPWELLRLRPDRGLSKFYRGTDTFRREWQSRSIDHSFTVRVPHHDDTPPPLPGYFWPTAADGAEADLRLVLFLQREAFAESTIWIPATAVKHSKFITSFRNESDYGRSPRSDFSRSVALVEGGRVVVPYRMAWRHDGPTDPYAVEPVAATLAEFKVDVMRRMQPIAVPTPPRDAPRRWADLNPLATVPPLAGP